MPELAAVDPEDCPKAAPSNRRTNLKRKLDTSTNSSMKMDSTKKQKLDSTFSIETAPVGDLGSFGIQFMIDLKYIFVSLLMMSKLMFFFH